MTDDELVACEAMPDTRQVPVLVKEIRSLQKALNLRVLRDENQRKERVIERQAALVSELDAYVDLLNKANEGPISLAWAHGWRCPQADIDKGKESRERIEALRSRSGG